MDPIQYIVKKFLNLSRTSRFTRKELHVRLGQTVSLLISSQHGVILGEYHDYTSILGCLSDMILS